MKKRKKVMLEIIIILFVVIGVALILQIVRKPVKETDRDNSSQDNAVVSEEIDYSGLGNEQGNLQNGGDQTYLKDRGILVKTTSEENNVMLCFDDSEQELDFYCSKSSCLHNNRDCVSNQSLRYLLSYADVVFGVPDSAVNEIWQCQNNEMSCFYRTKDDIYGLWGYQGYIYFMTDFGVFRISIENPSGEEKILDRPVLYEYLTFYENKMYFCYEDQLLYQANLDGSKKKRFCDEKLVSPQVCGDFLYYRSAEYDKKGKFQIKNTLKCISLKDKSEKVILDEVYQFNVDTKENNIYYTKLSTNDEVTLNVVSLSNGKTRKITDCASAYLYTFSESEWIVFEKYEGELEKDEEGGRPTHLYCIKKDGSGEKRLDYPRKVEE
ncbi:MAG: DUF5050 domain-containing protein [Clostridiaceae bacterium]|nr:DUF5050 domain-containing protein [Clostridiaceae bacterium]